MILIDANLLVYAHVASFKQHEAALNWLDKQLNGTTPVGLPWASLLSFVRLTSNPKIFDQPEPVAVAWSQAQDWLDCPTVWIPEPTDRHREILGGFLEGVVTKANLVPDAHLAALAIEHRLILCSADSDFRRFPGLRWENPLQLA